MSPQMEVFSLLDNIHKPLIWKAAASCEGSQWAPSRSWACFAATNSLIDNFWVGSPLITGLIVNPRGDPENWKWPTRRETTSCRFLPRLVTTHAMLRLPNNDAEESASCLARFDASTPKHKPSRTRQTILIWGFELIREACRWTPCLILFLTAVVFSGGPQCRH